MGFDAVHAALEANGSIVRQTEDSVSARCPAHDDQNPSLSLSRGDDGRALLFCHGGCNTADVAEALGLTLADLGSRGRSDGEAVAAIYVYEDEAGAPLHRVLRLSPKGFFQERWEDGEWKPGMRDTRRVPYRLPELLDAPHVIVTEGEKDADNVAQAWGMPATTLLGGAGKLRDEYLPYFKGKGVTIIPDMDDVGRDHASALERALTGIATIVDVRLPAHGKDVTDHILAGYTFDDLRLDDGGLDEFGPIDWDTYDDVPTEWLYEPYIPRQGRVLAFGSAGSLKSLWAMWMAAHLAREGKRVAYFSLEMLPIETARRVRVLSPPKENFYLFTKDLRLGSPSHTAKLMAGLKGFDLIVVDSWTAARTDQRESNEAVAALDREVLLPLIERTGASILILDNTGHAVVVDDGIVKQQHARGASAKGDKMEVSLWFDRPDEQNNYRTRLSVKKMRVNYPTPDPMTIETPQDRIEFYKVKGGVVTPEPAWPGLRFNVGEGSDEAASLQSAGSAAGSLPTTPEEVADDTPVPSTTSSVAGPGAPDPDGFTPAERRALARLKDKFGAVPVGEEVSVL